MFSGATSFNGDISDWNVSSVTDMIEMFDGASGFAQNLGNWYIVLDNTAISDTNETLAISAQNAYLDGQNSTYAVDDATGNGALFEVASGDLAIKSGQNPASGPYNITITSTGSFGTDNSRVVEIAVSIAQANNPPVADAGNAQTVLEGSAVTLNGTASDLDPEDSLAYSWSHSSALTITLDDQNAENPEFTAPNVASDTAVEFTLTVSDGTATVTDTVTVTITDSANTAPSVDAGTDQQVAEGSTVTLNGTATDPDTEDSLEYTWSHSSALTITLDDQNAENPEFTAPNVASDTAVEFTLTVSDGTATVSDKVIITVTDVPAQVPQSDPRGVYRLTLSSTESGVIEAVWNAPGETPADYRISWAKTGESFRTWTDLTGNAFPTGTSHTISDLEEGEEYKVKVRARYGGSAGDWSDASTITAAGTSPNQPANNPPVADAGNAQTVLEGSTVTLNGTASGTDGGTLTYLWSHDSNMNITFSDPSSLPTSFTAPQVDSDTTITITLTVSDGNFTVSDSVDITVTDVPAQVPQSDPRGVYRLTLSSTESGVIEAVWNAPGETPADYRISWAKTGESFRTWTDLTGNAFPTGTSHTISNLDEGDEYKVKVRARYGGSAGDWSDEVTVTVAGTG